MREQDIRRMKEREDSRVPTAPNPTTDVTSSSGTSRETILTKSSSVTSARNHLWTAVACKLTKRFSMRRGEEDTWWSNDFSALCAIKDFMAKISWQITCALIQARVYILHLTPTPSHNHRGENISLTGKKYSFDYESFFTLLFFFNISLNFENKTLI